MIEARHPRRVLRVSAYAVCVDGDQGLLLCRIAPGYTVGFDGWWTLPGGGLQHGEDPRVGAIRELAEETGLRGHIEGLMEVDSLHQVYTDSDGERVDHHAVRILYRCATSGGSLRSEVMGSTDACRWFTVDELRVERLVDIAQLAAQLTGHRLR